MVEEWRDIAGYEGLYQVSNLGRVKSLDKIRRDGHFVKGRILSLLTDSRGYLFVHLYKNGKESHVAKRVHRLVAEAFLSNSEDKPEIDHIDADPKNNRVDNLRWATRKENMNNPICIAKQRIVQKGKKASEETKAKMRGPRKRLQNGNHPMARKVIAVETGQIFGTIKEAAEAIHRAPNAIRCALKNGWTSGGCHWEYA